MTEERQDYRDRWDDLPAEAALGLRASRWRRGRTWTVKRGGGRVLRFERAAAVPVAVSEAAHGVLCGWLRDVVAVWREVERHAVETPPGGEKVKAWTAELLRATLRDLEMGLATAGFAPDQTPWVARMSAAHVACRQIGALAEAGRVLKLWMSDELPGATNLRLALNTLPGRELREAEGGWLWVPDLGWVAAAGESLWPDRVTAATYVEAAHVEQRWHLRFVFVSEEDAGPRGKKTEAEARSDGHV